MNPDGKVAIITGAGAGMGRATATALAAEGASILVVDIDPEAGGETARLIKDAGGKASFVNAHVSTPDCIRTMFDAAGARYGGGDILHHNPGIPCGAPDWPEVSLERIAYVVALNTSG